MKRPIDLAFISAQGRVLKSERAVKPGRFQNQRGAWGCLERYASSDSWFEVGEDVEFSVLRKER